MCQNVADVIIEYGTQEIKSRPSNSLSGEIIGMDSTKENPSITENAEVQKIHVNLNVFNVTDNISSQRRVLNISSVRTESSIIKNYSEALIKDTIISSVSSSNLSSTESTSLPITTFKTSSSTVTTSLQSKSTPTLILKTLTTSSPTSSTRASTTYFTASNTAYPIYSPTTTSATLPTSWTSESTFRSLFTSTIKPTTTYVTSSVTVSTTPNHTQSPTLSYTSSANLLSTAPLTSSLTSSSTLFVPSSSSSSSSHTFTSSSIHVNTSSIISNSTSINGSSSDTSSTEYKTTTLVPTQENIGITKTFSDHQSTSESKLSNNNPIENYTFSSNSKEKSTIILFLTNVSLKFENMTTNPLSSFKSSTGAIEFVNFIQKTSHKQKSNIYSEEDRLFSSTISVTSESQPNIDTTSSTSQSSSEIEISFTKPEINEKTKVSESNIKTISKTTHNHILQNSSLSSTESKLSTNSQGTSTTPSLIPSTQSSLTDIKLEKTTFNTIPFSDNDLTLSKVPINTKFIISYPENIQRDLTIDSGINSNIGTLEKSVSKSTFHSSLSNPAMPHIVESLQTTTNNPIYFTSVSITTTPSIEIIPNQKYTTGKYAPTIFIDKGDSVIHPPYVLYEAIVDILIKNDTWKDDYRNTSSKSFIEMTKYIKKILMEELQKCYIDDVTLYALRPGSLVANISLMFTQNISLENICKTLELNNQKTFLTCNIKEKKLPGWAIIIIAVLCSIIFIFILLIIFGIIHYKKYSKKHGLYDVELSEEKNGWIYPYRYMGYQKSRL